MKSLARNSVYPYLGVKWFKVVGVVLFCKAIYIASQHINKEINQNIIQQFAIGRSGFSSN